ncbi:TraB/GumN family protein, partial [Myxococcota bacterium]|nr:TraB/GumN family protein [Myxococcota bacterium]
EPELKKASLPIPYVDRMQPWLVELLLQAEAMRQLSLSPRYSVDSSFIEQVGDRSIIGLESIKFQIALLTRMPLKVQSASLRHTLTHFKSFEEEVQAVVQAWRRGDEQMLTRLFSLDGSADPSEETFLKLFTFRRSQSMAEQLGVLLNAEQHQGERVFVVMGIQHVVGQQGIPSLLQKKGYAVKLYSPSALLHALPGD